MDTVVVLLAVTRALRCPPNSARIDAEMRKPRPRRSELDSESFPRLIRLKIPSGNGAPWLDTSIRSRSSDVAQMFTRIVPSGFDALIAFSSKLAKT